MSTLVARLNFDGRPADPDALERMLEVQRHRKFTDANVWVDGDAAFGQGVRYTADHTPYPIQSADGRFTIIADARLDNRDELIRLLGLDVPADQDGLILVEAYRRWGRGCAPQLRGDFAFVIYDVTEKECFAARDPFGVRNLYYHHLPHRHVVFSSEIKGMWCHADIPKAVDETRLVEALQIMDSDPARTMFADVWAVPPAHTAVFSREKVQVERYWKLEMGEELQLPSMEAYAERLRELFVQSVRRRLRGVDKAAIELSGGLDSSSVACAARQITDAELHTLSLRYPAFHHIDEGAYIDAALETGTFHPHTLDGAAEGLVDSLDEVLERVDEPSLILGNHHLLWRLFAASGALGITVHLTGFDGDTVIDHGFDRFTELVHRTEWDTLIREANLIDENLQRTGSGAGDQLRDLKGGAIVNSYTRRYLDLASRSGKWFDFVRVAVSARKRFGLSERFWFKKFGHRLLTNGARRLGYKKNAEIEINPYIRPEVVRQHNVMAKAQKGWVKRGWPINSRQYQVDTLNSNMFVRSVDNVSLYSNSFGVEVAHPFLDVDLVTYCALTPSAVRLNDGYSRAILREAMKDILPEKIRLRAGKADVEDASRDSSAEGFAALGSKLISKSPVGRYISTERVAEKFHQTGDREISISQLSVMLAVDGWLKKHFG